MSAITVKAAVAAATVYLTEVFPEAKDVQLEEVALSDDESCWEVTLSFLRALPTDPDLPTSALSTSSMGSIFGGGKYERLYKLVTVDAHTGKCQSIRIRQLQ